MAREVGLVPGTLVQRFGSRHGLLPALADRSPVDAGEPAGRGAAGARHRAGRPDRAQGGDGVRDGHPGELRPPLGVPVRGPH
ncbi:LOW QUALITY PROTEIN: TetR family transcriptional regulator, partial [Streptomyces sp. C]